MWQYCLKDKITRAIVEFQSSSACLTKAHTWYWMLARRQDRQSQWAIFVVLFSIYAKFSPWHQYYVTLFRCGIHGFNYWMLFWCKLYSAILHLPGSTPCTNTIKFGINHWLLQHCAIVQLGIEIRYQCGRAVCFDHSTITWSHRNVFCVFKIPIYANFNFTFFWYNKRDYYELYVLKLYKL